MFFFELFFFWFRLMITMSTTPSANSVPMPPTINSIPGPFLRARIRALEAVLEGAGLETTGCWACGGW